MTSRIVSRPVSSIAKPVDPEAEPAGRRHPVRERLDVVRVAALALDAARPACAKRACSSRVVDLGERVAELHPADEVLEALGQRRVVVGRPRERRELDRVVVDDRRLDQLRLDEVAERVVDELRPVAVGARVDPALGQPGAQLGLVARPQLLAPRAPRRTGARATGALRSISWPRNCTVVVPSDLLRHGLDERLDPLHRVAVVGVRLVPLEHRELGLVLVRDALVAEVLAELVDPLEPADDQPLEVELGRDPQVEVAVELVVVRDERAREARRRSAAAGPASRPRRSPRRRGSARIAATMRARRTKSARVSSLMSRSR